MATPPVGERWTPAPNACRDPAAACLGVLGASPPRPAPPPDIPPPPHAGSHHVPSGSLPALGQVAFPGPAPPGLSSAPAPSGLACDFPPVAPQASFQGGPPLTAPALVAMAAPQAKAAAGAPPGHPAAQGTAPVEAPAPLPATMARVDVAAYGPPSTVLSVTTRAPLPPPPSPGKLLIAVEAVSLSPSDYRMLSGDTAWAKRLPGGSFPYTPGGDVAGTIVGVHPEDAARWAVGTPVVATWELCGTGGLAHYCLVDASRTAVRPRGVDALTGAAAANSAGHALLAVRAAGPLAAKRVLVLGGAGGVGSAVVQLARAGGAGHVAATASTAGRLDGLGVDDAIAYSDRNWAVLPPSTPPYDVIFDCAVGAAAWVAVTSTPGLLTPARSGGRFMAIHHDWRIVAHGVWDLVRFLGPMLGRMVGSRLRPWGPRYVMYLGSVSAATLGEVLGLVDPDGDGGASLRVLMDPAGPFPFTTDGVRAAFELHASHHARGKVVIDVAGTVTAGGGAERGG